MCVCVLKNKKCSPILENFNTKWRQNAFVFRSFDLISAQEKKDDEKKTLFNTYKHKIKLHKMLVRWHIRNERTPIHTGFTNVIKTK